MAKLSTKLVQNRSSELSEELKERYELKIAELLDSAKESAVDDANDFLSKVQDQVLDHEIRLNKDLDQAYQQSVAALRLDNKLAISNAKSKLVDAMMQELRSQFDNLDLKDKQMISKKMQDRILKKIKEQGFNVKDFTIHIYKEAKVVGCKSTLSSLAVRAESDNVVIEDSIDELLIDHRNEIIKIVSHHVDENLN